MKLELVHPGLTDPGGLGLQHMELMEKQQQTQAVACLLQNIHTTLAEKNIPGFLSEVGNSVSRREKKVFVSIFSISVSLKISSSDTHPNIGLQNLKVKSACTICLTILSSLLKSCPWLSPSPCHVSWYLKPRSSLDKCE